MAFETLGAGGLAPELKQTYSRALLGRTKPNWIHALFGDQTGIIRRGGNSIEWRRFVRPSAATTALTEGTSGAETNLTVTAIGATISQYGAWNLYTELVELQSFDPYTANVVELFGEQAKDTIDILARNVLTAGTTLQIASTAGSRGGIASGMRLNFAEIRAAVRALEVNNAPKFDDGAYKGIYHPRTKQDLFADSDVIQTFQHAGPRGTNNPLMSADMGRFYSVDWLETSNARNFGGAGLTSTPVYATIIFGKGAYGQVDLDAISMNAEFILHGPGSAGSLDPLNQRATAGWKVAYACRILDENRLVRIEHSVSSDSG